MTATGVAAKYFGIRTAGGGVIFFAGGRGGQMSRRLPGVVRMGMIKRLPNLLPGEFREHWRGPHGGLASKIPNLLRYHQNHTVEKLPFGDRRDRWSLDGFSQLWFDDIDTMMKGITAPAYGGLAKDTAAIMSMPGLLVGPQELVKSGDRTLPDKAMLAVGRRADLTAEAFAAEWRRKFGSLANVDGLAAMTNIFIVHRERAPASIAAYEDLPVDVVCEFWFTSTQAMRRAFAAAVPDVLWELAENASAYAVKTHVIVK